MTEISLIVTLSKQFNTQLNQSKIVDAFLRFFYLVIFAYFNAISIDFYPPWGPPWGPGGLSRECVLRIPMRVVKGD